MNNWWRRLRGAFGMGLIWAAGMAGVGGFIELLDNILPGGLPGADAVDMWPQELMIPGFLGGVIFSVVVMIAAGRRRFDELSIPGFTAMGVVGGLLLGVGVFLEGCRSSSSESRRSGERSVLPVH